MSSTFYCKAAGAGAETAEISFIAQIVGNKCWDELTVFEKNKIFGQAFGNESKVLFSTIVQLEFITKETQTLGIGRPDEYDDNWTLYERRIFCLTLNHNRSPLYALEFISQESGSVYTLEIQADFKYSTTVENHFVIFEKKLKEKFKKLAFSTNSKDKLLEFVEILNRIIIVVTMDENKPRKFSAVPTSPQPKDIPADGPSSPSAASGQNPGASEPLTAKRIIEIIRKMFDRKEEKKKKLQKTDISAPTDFRHIQHVGMEPDNNGGRQLSLEIPTVPITSGCDNESLSNSSSPTQDKHTMNFIYDVIEECRERSSRPPRADTRHVRQTVHFPMLPTDLTDSEMSTLFDMKDPEAKQPLAAYNNNSERARLIRDLRIHLQDEDTRKLIFEFIETYKQEVQSAKIEANTAWQSELQQSGGANKWSSGRNSAPPPPHRPAPPIPSFNFSSEHTKHDVAENSDDDGPADYTELRESLRAELRHNLSSKVGAQNGLGRSNTWSNAQNTISAIPSTKPPIKVNNSVKKANSDVRRRPNSPPPPILQQLNSKSTTELASHPSPHVVVPNFTKVVNDNEEAAVSRLAITHPEETTIKPKPPPPIPKPRKTVHRMHSNPSTSEYENHHVKPDSIQASRSFDTDSGTGMTPQIQLVAELKDRIDSINNKEFVIQE